MPSDAGRWRVFAAILVAAGLLAYANSLQGPFFFDDLPSITENPSIEHLSRLGEVLSPPSADGRAVGGRPIVNLSLALNYAISGYQVWSYHAANIAIHLLCGLTLFGILRRTLPRALPGGVDPCLAAFAGALLWIVHPLQTESVTSVIQRTESLMGLFYLLTLYGFIRAAEDGGTGRAWRLVCVVACLLGMGTKEVMATAPVIVFLYDRTFLAGSFAEAWRRRKGLHLALASTWIALAALLVHVGGTRGGAAGFGLGVSEWRYLLTQARAIALYLRLSLWPHPLVVDYGQPLASGLAAVWPQALLVVALLAATAWALVRRPALGFCGAWFFVILAPSSSFVPLITQTIAEHRMYLPLAALTALAAIAILAARPRAGRIVVAVLAGAGVGATAARNTDYRSAIAIWADTAAKLPDSVGAHNNLGIALQDAGRTAEARAQFDAALRLDPRYAQAHYNLANLLLDQGDVDAAIGHYAATEQDDPTFTRVHGNFGIALLRVGRTQDAIRELVRAVAVDPGRSEAHYNLAGALVRADYLIDAIREYRKAVELKPDFADAHFNLAEALAQSGRSAEAAAEFQAVLKLNPGDADARAALERLAPAP